MWHLPFPPPDPGRERSSPSPKAFIVAQSTWVRFPACNHLLLQFQVTWCPLLVTTGIAWPWCTDTCMQSILTNKRNKILNRTKFKSLCYHGILMTGLMEGSTPTSTSFNLIVVHSHQPFFHRKNPSFCLFGQNLDGKLAFSPNPSRLVVVVGYWGAWFLCTSVSLTRIFYHQIMHPTCLSGSLYQLILKNQGGPQ